MQRRGDWGLGLGKLVGSWVSKVYGVPYLRLVVLRISGFMAKSCQICFGGLSFSETSASEWECRSNASVIQKL